MSPVQWYRKLNEDLRKGRAFLENDLWYRPLPPLRSWSGLLLRMTRFCHLVYLGLREDRLKLHAASLTFTTLMTLLPLLAIGLSIAEGFGQHEVAEERLLEYTKDMPEHFETLTRSLIDLVSQTDFAKLGAVGGLFLLFMTIQMLSRIEASFNQVWNIAYSRTWLRRISNYISVVVIVPILLLGAITITANRKWGGSESIFNLFGWMPYVSLWIAFSFLYGAMPNTRVKPWAAAAGGLIGALLWQGWFRLYILLQPGITRYNALYGALASIPVFLAWLYVSWQIILLGSRITYAVQAGGATLPQFSRRSANLRTRILIAISVLVEAAHCHRRSDHFLTRKPLVKHHSLNPELLEDVINALVEAELLVESNHDTPRLQPGLAPDQISLRMVIDAFLSRGDHAHDLGIDQIEPLLVDRLGLALDRGGEHLDQTIDGLRSDIPSIVVAKLEEPLP